MTRGTCEECGQPDRPVGPFKAADRQYARVCGVCKFRITLRDPHTKARLAAEARSIGEALQKGPQ